MSNHPTDKRPYCACGELQDDNKHACPVTHAYLRAEIERLERERAEWSGIAATRNVNIALIAEERDRLRNDIQELTCGDPRRALHWRPIATKPPGERVLLWFPELGYAVTGDDDTYSYKSGGWKATHWQPAPLGPDSQTDVRGES